jgi:DNA-binding IclR family transcriptional regulator
MGDVPIPASERTRRADPDGDLQSVRRAISVIEFLAKRNGATIKEVAAAIGVHRSTAFRLLGALEAHGLVCQVVDRSTYRIGPGLGLLAAAVIGRLDLTRAARPVCTRLAAEIGETVNVAVLYGPHALNLDQAVGQAVITIQNRVGHLVPLHCTSTGKVLLAHASHEQRQRLLAESGLPVLTPHTITSAAALAADLQATLARGYAVAMEEYEIGLNAMAAPIRGHDGAVAAAASVSGPAYRLDASHMEGLVPALLGGAAEITDRLGSAG